MKKHFKPYILNPMLSLFKTYKNITTNTKLPINLPAKYRSKNSEKYFQKRF